MSAADIHWGPLIAILAMAGATYLMRTSGYLVMGSVSLTPWIQRMLDALPGCVITATIVPVLARSGSPALIGVAIVVAVMAWLRNEFLAIAVGMGAIMAVRALGF